MVIAARAKSRCEGAPAPRRRRPRRNGLDLCRVRPDRRGSRPHVDARITMRPLHDFHDLHITVSSSSLLFRNCRIDTNPRSKLRQITPRVFDIDHFGRRFLDFSASTERAQRRVINVAFGSTSDIPSLVQNVACWGIRCYEAEGCGLKLLRLFQHRSEGATR